MDFSSYVAIIGMIAMILGALIFATAGIGLFRFSDTFMRMSAVGTAGGVGIILVVVGTLLVQPTVADTVKVVVIIILQLGSSAVGTMAVARSAYLTGNRMNPGYFDELEEDDAEYDPAHSSVVPEDTKK